MDEFEIKYGIKEDQKIIDFHKSRRMFCIHDNKLFLAEPNLPYSHAVWFENLGWISKEEDKLMDEIVRGMIDSEGDIYFYKGYDFKIDEDAELVLLNHLNELKEQLNLSPEAKLFGGLIKQNQGKWPSRKEYGKIKDLQ